LTTSFGSACGATLKYEDIYLHRYATVLALADDLERYFVFYNDERPHQSLENRTLAAAYWA
jgi:putative transposase